MVLFAWVRLSIILLILLSVVYVCLSWYSRSMRREKLEKLYDAGGQVGPREQFIEDGLRAYEGSLRRKLIWGVYIIPVILIAVMIYVINYM
jgi:hypothetical protein